MSDQEIEDGFGSSWMKCDRKNCGLQVVRPGKTQCWCDEEGKYSLWFAGQDDADLYEEGWNDCKRETKNIIDDLLEDIHEAIRIVKTTGDTSYAVDMVNDHLREVLRENGVVA